MPPPRLLLLARFPLWVLCLPCCPGPQASKGERFSSLPPAISRTVPASDARAHAVANSGVSSDGNYGGMSSAVISVARHLSPLCHLGWLGWDRGRGGGGGPGEGTFPHSDQYISPRVVSAIKVSLLLRDPDQEKRSQKRSAFVPLNCFIYPGTSTLPDTQ